MYILVIGVLLVCCAGAGGVGFTPHVIMVQAGEVCDFLYVKE